MKYKDLIRNGFERSICVSKVIPEIKTISAYETALEEAIEILFKERNERDILDILSDAKKHRKWPKEYTSLGTEYFSIKGIIVKKAKFSLKRMEINIQIIGYSSITVKPNEISVSSDIKKKSAFWKEIEFFQQVLKKVEEINN